MEPSLCGLQDAGEVAGRRVSLLPVVALLFLSTMNVPAVDVCVRLGTNELTHVDQALARLNMRERESYKRNYYRKHGWVERDQAVNFVLKLT